MLFGFFSRVSNASSLKDALDVSTQRTRAISARVANATVNGGTGFALPGGVDPTQPNGAVNLEAEMTSLADEQLHYETTAKLLEKTYQQIRTSIRS